jgi:2-alkyl-3-oxoalkanoate reductase
MNQYAILGANGFIGYRLTEYLVLNEVAAPRPIVRSFRSIARLSKFGLDVRVADATDSVALTANLKGCSVVFLCVVGDRSTILRSVKATYEACRNARVRRLIYLSSAVVHGHDPDPGTNEESPLRQVQPLAEQKLKALGADGAVECVVLRPWIVYGPRSTYWTAQIASEILVNRAYLVDGGSGICNTVFVDNLIELMCLCAEHPAAAGRAFLVKDQERVTWLTLYSSIAKELGLDASRIASIPRGVTADLLMPPLSRRLLRYLWYGRIGRATKELVRSQKTVSIARRFRQTIRLDRALYEKGTTYMALDPEIVSLQQCRCELPIQRAASELGYRPSISFNEGARRSGEWLRFAFGHSSWQAEHSDPSNPHREEPALH